MITICWITSTFALFASLIFLPSTTSSSAILTTIWWTRSSTAGQGSLSYQLCSVVWVVILVVGSIVRCPRVQRDHRPFTYTTFRNTRIHRHCKVFREKVFIFRIVYLNYPLVTTNKDNTLQGIKSEKINANPTPMYSVDCFCQLKVI